ncbi:MAG: U32 family peptidase [Thermodesulfobacteriota bacterium]|nr:U32 family peptidase [Thermodesulfobacteriota bacterium]
METKDVHKPLILAPAGNHASFMAALAAGADAVYCGLKDFSARMTADNFTPDELARLTAFAHDNGVRVNVALNTLIKPDEVQQAFSIVRALTRHVRPDGIIIQDLGFIELARQAGYKGEVHLSTLAAVTFAKSLEIIQSLGVQKVVLPREFSIDEIKQAAGACPANMELEVFIHGALCYGVSGRCYWSSYMGGKSGLRGRCVQPCRRTYTTGKRSGRFFSCLDFSVDVLAKTLLTVPRVTAWKIEGRKKGPHYVYYTTTAYKLLRDQGSDPKAKQIALGYLEQALGRKTTHYNFLPQRSFPPANTGDQTGSGLMVGRVRAGGKNSYVVPTTMLLAGDLLRIGYEDQPGHRLYRTQRFVPKKGRLHIQLPGKHPAKGVPVFLIDRLEPGLAEEIEKLETALAKIPAVQVRMDDKSPKVPGGRGYRRPVTEVIVSRVIEAPPVRGRDTGLWFSPQSAERLPLKSLSRYWWWLPPVIWESDASAYEKSLQAIITRGARRFVVNAPWQMAFFDACRADRKFEIWAGPFCNQANGLSIRILEEMGFSGVVVSPELESRDYVSLPGQSILPVGIVIKANWPLCLSRTLPDEFQEKRLFSSPRKENAWAVYHDHCFWVYPDWMVDLSDKEKELEKKGYRMFVHIMEPLPGHIPLKRRPGHWNWDAGLA